MTDSKEEQNKWDPYREDKVLGKRMDITITLFRLTCADEYVSPAEKVLLKAQLMAAIKESDMAPLYKQLCAQFKDWDLDQEFVAKMEATNSAKCKEFDATYKDALENLGEDEILDAALAKANYLSLTWDKPACLKAFKLVREKSFSRGQKIDAAFHIMRNGFLHSDLNVVRDEIKDAKIIVEQGGDWDRRNRLQVYEGIYLLSQRNVQGAADLFLGSVATFTCFELVPYDTLVAYAVLSSMVALDRAALQKKVVKNSEILSRIGKVPHLSELLHAFYECRYRDFFEALVGIHSFMICDRILARHAPYFVRELRIRAYAQLLQSYQSVTMESMAETFGVSVAFLDRELSRFIGVKRLAAKIDKVSGIVETNRPDAKNAQYQDVIKHGDALLNQIHKLTRVIRM